MYFKRLWKILMVQYQLWWSIYLEECRYCTKVWFQPFTFEWQADRAIMASGQIWSILYFCNPRAFNGKTRFSEGQLFLRYFQVFQVLKNYLPKSSGFCQWPCSIQKSLECLSAYRLIPIVAFQPTNIIREVG